MNNKEEEASRFFFKKNRGHGASREKVLAGKILLAGPLPWELGGGVQPAGS